MAALIIQSGKRKGKKLMLPAKDAEIVVGRDEDCTIRLATSDVSRKHCVMKTVGDTIFVRDLGSQNGTYVNDHRIDSETELQAGDILRIGPMIFQVAGKKPKPAAAAKPVDKSERASDDEIVSWLVDEDADGGPVASTETTIISKETPTASAPGKPDSSSEIPVEPVLPKRRFRSVAEEGADIIRRHQELQRERERGS